MAINKTIGRTLTLIGLESEVISWALTEYMFPDTSSFTLMLEEPEINNKMTVKARFRENFIRH